MTSDDAAVPAGARQLGVIYALLAFTLWGVTPVFYKSLGQVPVLEIVAHRVVWSVLLIGVIVGVRGRFGMVGQALRTRRTLAYLMLTTALVSFNWLVFVWAVGQGRIMESSLGYFLTPLINVLLGLVFLGERLRAPQITAVMLASAGVATLAYVQGVAPWIGLSLAVTFGLYGYFRKILPVEALEGLFIECLLLLAVAGGYLIWLQLQGRGSFLAAGGGLRDLLLIGTGPVTALPLLFFAMGARRIKLATLGLAQYVAPSLMFLISVMVYGEAFTLGHKLTFGLIWLGLLIYSADALREERAGIRAVRAAVSGRIS